MLFNSITYLFFLPVVVLAYWLSPAAFKKPLLLMASYFFYMSWMPVYGLLLFALTAVNYLLGLCIDRYRNVGKSLLFLGLCVNLGTLCFYKYANFFLTSFFNACSTLPSLGSLFSFAPDSSFHLNVVLPLGISFFAFEFIHYLVDVNKGGKPIKNTVDFALFAAFFPSQIAGPIKRYQDFVTQLSKPVFFQRGLVASGLSLILQGLFKKIALSDNLAPLVEAGFNQTAGVGTIDVWIAVVAFAFQIYFDFSGYTDMGRGSAMMLGFSLPDNFNLPYLARNLSDFWKRWHISLSSWLRDYLYIPLGGNKSPGWGKHRNLMVTMALGGLWHGAAWHYVAWGLLHGFGLVVSHEYAAFVKRSKVFSDFHNSKLGTGLSVAATFFIVLLGWIFFRADNMSQASSVVFRMFSLSQSYVVILMLKNSVLPVAASVYAIYAMSELAARYPSPFHNMASKIQATVRVNLPLRISTWLTGWILAVGFAPTKVAPFIYFQF